MTLDRAMARYQELRSQGWDHERAKRTALRWLLASRKEAA